MEPEQLRTCGLVLYSLRVSLMFLLLLWHFQLHFHQTNGAQLCKGVGLMWLRPTTLASPAMCYKRRKSAPFGKYDFVTLSTNCAMTCASAVLSDGISTFWLCDRIQGGILPISPTVPAGTPPGNMENLIQDHT